jgi:O-antigen/teichoic acid export membrane protein
MVLSTFVGMLKPFGKYINNISALQFIQLLRFGTLFLAGVVFVRFYSTPQIGEFETLLLVAGAVTFFWLRGLLQSFLAGLSYNSEKSNRLLYFNGFILSVAFSLMAVFFLLIFKSSVQNWLNHSYPIRFFNLMLAYVLVSSPVNLIEYIYLGQQQSRNIFRYALVSYGLQLLLLVLPPVLALDIEFAVIGLIIINVLRFLWLVYLLIKHATFKIDWVLIKGQLVMAWPLIGSSLLSGSAQYIDGFLVTHFFDAGQLAIFRYGAREFPVVLILTNALGNALIPEFGHNPHQALIKLKSNISRMMHLFFPVTIILLATSHIIYPIIFSNEFLLSASIFNLYLILVIPRLILVQTILLGYKQTGLFMWVSFIEVAINVILSLLLLRYFGIIGIAMSTFIAFLAEKLILVYQVRTKLNIRMADYLNIKWFYIYSVITLGVYILVDWFIYK